MLVFPELAGLGMHEEALRVPMPVRPDLGERVLAADEGVVGRNPPVVEEAEDLARVARQRLRAVLVVTIADGHEQMRADEREPAAVMEAVFGIGLGCEDALAIQDALAAEAEAIEGSGAAVEVAGRVGDVDPAVARVLRMQREVMHACVLVRQGRGAPGIVDSVLLPHDCDEAGLQRSQRGGARIHEVDARAAPLDEEPAAVGQEDHRRRLLELRRDLLDLEACSLRVERGLGRPGRNCSDDQTERKDAGHRCTPLSGAWYRRRQRPAAIPKRREDGFPRRNEAAGRRTLRRFGDALRNSPCQTA